MPNDAKQLPPEETIRRGHETRDASAKGIALVALFSVVAFAAMEGALYLHFTSMAKYSPVPHPVIAEKKSDVAPHQELVSFEQREHRVLNSYDWIDREHGIVHIPIERAMELLAQRGLPVRTGPSKNEKSPLELQRERAAEK